MLETPLLTVVLAGGVAAAAVASGAWQFSTLVAASAMEGKAELPRGVSRLRVGLLLRVGQGGGGHSRALHQLSGAGGCCAARCAAGLEGREEKSEKEKRDAVGVEV